MKKAEEKIKEGCDCIKIKEEPDRVPLSDFTGRAFTKIGSRI